MSLSITVPQGYGYTVLVALGAIPLLAQIQGSISTSLRKPAQVPYPNHYATAEQAKSNQNAHKYNCAQRAHGNLLENMPQTIVSMLFAGLFYPTAAPILGVAWTAFRVVYAYGYIWSTKPQGKGRLYGSGMWLPQLGLWGLCIAAGLKML